MKKTIYTFYAINFLSTLVFTTAIWSFFFTSYLTFTFGQGLFIITFSGIISSIFEVPSGAWADRYGRKNMYLIGTILIIIDLIIWCVSKNFYLFLLAGALAGIGNAMLSGNLEALIHDKLEEEKRENEYKNITANSYASIFIGRALATSVSGFMFIFNPLMPVYLTILSTFIILVLAFTLKEPKQILSEHKDNFSHLKETIKFLKKEKIIMNFIVILGLLSSIGNVYYFTQQPYFKEIGFKIEHIGILFTVGALVSALGSYLFKKISNKLNEKELLKIFLLLTFMASVLFIFFGKIYAIIGLAIISLMFGYIMTFGNNFMISRIPKDKKSTILSVFSLAITIGYSSFNIILSLFLDKIGLFNIYLINIFLIIILIIFTLSTFNRYKI